MSIAIHKCVCTGTPATTFQDRIYGIGRRVFNYTAREEAKCTCCSMRMRDPNGPRPKKKSGTGGGKSYVAYPPVGGWPGGPPEKNGWRPIGSK